MVAAEGRAAGRDGGGDPGQVAGHDVRVALDDDRPAGLGDVLLGEVDAVQDLGLLVDRRVGGVQVLRAVVVVVAACARRSRRPRRRCRGSATSAGRGSGRWGRGGPPGRGRRASSSLSVKPLPRRKRVRWSQPWPGCSRRRSAAAAAWSKPRSARNLRPISASGLAELLDVELGGDLVGLDQADALAALVGGVVAALLVAQGDAGLARPGARPPPRRRGGRSSSRT